MANQTPPDEPDADSPGEPVSFRIRRYGSARGSGGPARVWRALTTRGWTRRLAIAVLLIAVLYGVIWFTVIRTLPSADKLLTYQPTLPTMVRGGDGEIVSTFARERRVELRYVDFPQPLIGAFLSAEDKSFFQHHGVDITGLGAAVIDYATKYGTGSRARGGSTITQQVAKNLLIGNEYKVSRKLKEMFLAMRIESVLTKQQILEIYLNEIALGRNSFGVQAAARAYFDKDVGDLKLQEAAFLAILPKAPEEYGRAKFVDKALNRRNWVLDQMVKNGYVTRAQADDAKAQPLGLVQRRPDNYTTDAGYFLEEVRRQLISQFGENPDDGANSVYGGGLWVRTSLDTRMQSAAQASLRAGLLRYAAGRGWHGPIATVDPAQWQGQLIGSNLSIHYLDWRVGVILQKSGSSGRIGFADGLVAPISGLFDAVRPGDVVAAAPNGSEFALRIIPEVSGGMVVQDPADGRVLAMQGGFDARLGSFNRATQANRPDRRSSRSSMRPRSTTA
jgi:penicillin-binding protein 1A